MIRRKFLYHGENEQNNNFWGWFLTDLTLPEYFRLHSVRHGYLLARGQKDRCPHLEMEKLNSVVLHAHLIHSAQRKVSLE
jgi:hypothetical protein